MRKSIIFLAFLLVLTVSTTAFAEVTIRVAWWGSQDRHDRTLKVIEMFEKEYPDINIEPEFLGFDGYWENRAAQAAGGNLPDVWQHGYGLISRYIEGGLLLDLSEYVAKGDLNPEVIDSSIVVDDKMFGVTLGYNALALMYDPAVLEEAGVSLEPGYTYEDFMEICRKIKKETGKYAKNSFLFNEDIDGFCSYLGQHGTDLYFGKGFERYGSEITELGYDDDQLFIDYHSMELELLKEGVFAPIDLTLEVTNVEEDLITTGDVAIAGYWSNQIVALQSAAGRPIEMTIPPKDKNQVQNGLVLQPSQYFVVTSYTKYPEEAVKFLNFFTDNIEANKVLMGERGVPASGKVREALIPLFDDATAKTLDYIDLAVDHAGKMAPPYPGEHNQIRQEYDNIREMILFGVITPEEGAREFRTKVNEILSN